ncbi:hypothetical protein INT47_007526 [Mucor saturninus]|uniref:UspA domain-containing protein n=1 Tax=Mucor saturninus TaxID=64648 RepID=A0A8H7R485_9FUNG|nr:hypothetical protein INT47_007526 [Mucor saturninus]
MSTSEHPPLTKKDTLVHFNEGHAEEGHELTRVVLICLDPESADITFQWALDNFITPTKDLVILVHVRQIDIPVAPYIDSTGFIDDVSEERREESHHLLRVFAAELHKRKVACKAISMVGDPKSELLRKAKEIKADVVLVGARKMGAIKRTLLGSVSDYIVHNCPCTVIVTKPEEENHTQERRRSIVSLTSSPNTTK